MDRAIAVYWIHFHFGLIMQELHRTSIALTAAWWWRLSKERVPR